MKMKSIITIAVVACCSTGLAGIINGGTLLANADANQLESWLGISDQDFTLEWQGNAGASSASFHSAVDGVGPTFSILEITLANSSIVRIGGYTSLSWGGAGYASDSSAFLFNLDTLEKQQNLIHPAYSIYRSPSYFSTFGNGHDLRVSANTLGGSGYMYSYGYDTSQGNIAIAGDSGGSVYTAFTVNSLEVYTAADAIPEPATLAFVGIFGGGLLFVRKYFPSV